MKRIEVLSLTIDTDVPWDQPDYYRHVIERWIKSDEGKFIEKHSQKPIEIRTVRQPYSYDSRIELWATLEEKIETFWRLKFK